MKKTLTAALAATLILAPTAAFAGGSDGPTPYTVDTNGITLPAGDTFRDNGHINVKTTANVMYNIHFEDRNWPVDHPKRAYIGESFIPWIADPPSAWDTDDDGGYQMQAGVRVQDAGSITWDDHGGEVFKPEDAAYIAAADPPTMLTLLDEIERLRGENEWEYQGVPIYEDGREAVGRSIEACQGLVESHANPAHWIHEEQNYDLTAIVAYRVERRRKAGPWEPVEEGRSDR